MELKTTFAQRAIENLSEELVRVQREVRAKASDENLRTYLFQLLALQGNWRRALEQLQVCAQLSAKALPMAQMYREAIRCELLRADVFAGKRAPQVLGEPPEWMGSLVQALERLAAGDADGAAKLRQAAFDDAPTSSGSINGTNPFEWIADADSRLGPVCECIINGQYYWLPFMRVRMLRIDPPADLRDLIWAAAHLTLANGGSQIALIPARYPGSESADDDALKLSRRTEWINMGSDTYRGVGQKMLVTDAAEFSLLDIRSIEVTDASTPA
jgi:type VI secretion system protein ImpE